MADDPPGPSKGLKKGREQIRPIAINPQILPANGDITLANTLPMPDPWIIPISNATNPINGMIVCNIVSTASLAAW